MAKEKRCGMMEVAMKVTMLMDLRVAMDFADKLMEKHFWDNGLITSLMEKVY